MSSLTTNLKLVKPELQDNITPTIFADNFDKIDAALEGVSGGALSLEEIEASTNLDGKIPSAAALKEVNNSLGGFSFKTVDGKKQVSIDGGSTWSNFSGGAELLWTNPAPTSLFNAQTLSIDLSNYESVIIQAKGWYAENTYTPLEIIIPKDGKPHLIVGNQADYTGKMGIYTHTWYAREVTLTNDSIIFGGGYVTGANGSRNDACIPLEIYGTGLSLE